MGLKTKIAITIAVFGLIVAAFYGLVVSTGVTNVSELQEIVKTFGTLGWVIFLAIQIIATTIMSFVPGTSMTFVTMGMVLYGPIYGFLISALGVFISSMLMFTIGDKLGVRVAEWLVGKKSLDKAQNIITNKSKIILPLTFIFPFFPDDAICMIAGMTKMRYRYFAIVTLIFRSIGVASIAFVSSGVLGIGAYTITDWLIVSNLLLFDLVIIWKYTMKLEKVLIRRSHKKETVVKSKENYKELFKELMEEKTYIIVRDEEEIKKIMKEE